MQCLIVGADKIGAKKDFLARKFGVTKILHWDGRQKKLPPLPQVDLVLVLTGFVNHQLMNWVKKEAKRRNVRVVYLKRGVSELLQTA